MAKKAAKAAKKKIVRKAKKKLVVLGVISVKKPLVARVKGKLVTLEIKKVVAVRRAKRRRVVRRAAKKVLVIRSGSRGLSIKIHHAGPTKTSPPPPRPPVNTPIRNAGLDPTDLRRRDG